MDVNGTGGLFPFIANAAGAHSRSSSLRCASFASLATSNTNNLWPRSLECEIYLFMQNKTEEANWKRTNVITLQQADHTLRLIRIRTDRGETAAASVMTRK